MTEIAGCFSIVKVSITMATGKQATTTPDKGWPRVACVSDQGGSRPSGFSADPTNATRNRTHAPRPYRSWELATP